MNIGENIKKLRKTKNITQGQLAALSGISKNALWNYENGHREPSIEILNKISTTLDVDMFTLLIQDQNIFNGTNNLKLMKAIKEIGKIDNEIIGLKNEQSVLKKEILLDNLKLIENTSTHYKLTEYEKEILIFLSTPETQMAFNYDFKKIIKDEEFLLSLITRISFTLRLEFDMYNKK